MSSYLQPPEDRHVWGEAVKKLVNVLVLYILKRDVILVSSEVIPAVVEWKKIFLYR